MEVSDAAFKEIKDKLVAAGYFNQILTNGKGFKIDMYGIALVPVANRRNQEQQTEQTKCPDAPSAPKT